MKKKVLITGSKGFIGKAFANATKDLFNQVLIDAEILENNWQQKLSDIFRKDMFYAVFHFGACSDTLNNDLDEMMTKNVLFTQYLCNLCNFFDVPIIYSSSASVYGGKTDKLSLYAYSKLISEQYVTKCGGIGLRYFNVYGHDERHKGRMASVALQSFLKHRNGEKVLLFPKTPVRDFVYIRDVISANLYAFNNYNKLKGDWYDVGSGYARPFEHVLDILKIPYNYTKESKIPPNYQFYTKANKRLGDWQPQWLLEQGLSEYRKKMKRYK